MSEPTLQSLEAQADAGDARAACALAEHLYKQPDATGEAERIQCVAAVCARRRRYDGAANRRLSCVPGG